MNDGLRQIHGPLFGGGGGEQARDEGPFDGRNPATVVFSQVHRGPSIKTGASVCAATVDVVR